LLERGLAFLLRFADDLQGVQAKDAILRVLGGAFVHPAANRVDSLGDTLLLGVRAPFLERSNRQVVTREEARLGRRTVADRAPMVRFLVALQEVLDDSVGRRVRRPATEFQREERVTGRVD